MSTKLIHTKKYLLFVNEEAEIKEGDIAIHDFGMEYDLEIPCDKDNLKSNTRKLVVAYRPRTKEAEELDLPLLPPFEKEINIEKLAKEHFPDKSTPGYIDHWNLRSQQDFIAGYKAAQSDKQYSLDDMKKAIEMARKTFPTDKLSCDRYSTEEIIQSLSTQQLPKEFKPEYINEPIYIGDGCHKDNWILKTAINSECKYELVGTYKY